MPSLKPILLIEDDTVDAMSVEKALKQLEVRNELVHFTNCEQSLEYLTTNNGKKPCVILLDLNMPGLNGAEFLKAVKADDALKKIPVIVLSGSSEERDIVETFDLGVAGYIFKPIDYKKFDELKSFKLYCTTGCQAQKLR